MTKVYTLPGTQMEVEVILASKVPEEMYVPTLYTLRMKYPRIIHGEIMTHRMFSRNARSSRAVPVKTMLKEVNSTPFVPWHWGTNQKGMQAGEPLSAITKNICKTNWKVAAKDACLAAENLMSQGVHKQIPNRLLEPFSYIDTLITATDWANFLWLRDHADAEPHLQDLARLVKQALEETTPQTIDYATGWHLPYVSQDEITTKILPWAMSNDQLLATAPELAFTRSKLLAAKISASRCARISYKPFDGNDSFERELERFGSLVGSDRVHASPLEHQATPDAHQDPALRSNLRGWNQFRKFIPSEYVFA